jgi:hypothetical protein
VRAPRSAGPREVPPSCFSRQVTLLGALLEGQRFPRSGERSSLRWPSMKTFSPPLRSNGAAPRILSRRAVATFWLLCALSCHRSDSSYRAEVAAALSGAKGPDQVRAALASNFSHVAVYKWRGHENVSELRVLDFTPCHVAKATIAIRRLVLFSAATAHVVLDCEGTVRKIVIGRQTDSL